MAIYSSKCKHCETEYEYVRKIAERNDTPICCDTHTVKQLDMVMTSAGVWTGHGGFVAHNNQGKPQYIESATDHKRFMRDNKLMPASEGYREADIRRESIQRDRDASRKKRVAEIVSKL